jgi:hypothetical protein
VTRARWAGITGRHWTKKTQSIEIVGGALASFGFQAFENESVINDAVGELRKAESLVDAVERWETPVVGNTKYPTATDDIRGVQWRLCIAHAGWETLSRAVGATPQWKARNSVKVTTEPLPKPSSAKLDTWVRDAGATAFDVYWGLNEHAWPRMRSWLVDGQSIEHHEDAMGVATCLRHATVHGMLSPSKVKEWELGEPFSVLTDHLCSAVEAGFVKLCAAAKLNAGG